MKKKQHFPFGWSPGAWLAILIALPFVLWLVWGLFGVGLIANRWGTSEHDLSKLGQAGDLFGGINALFAAYAFVGVAVAAWFQKQTFDLVDEQQRLQSFEPLFFKMLEMLQKSTPTTLRRINSTNDEPTEYVSDGFAKALVAACSSVTTAEPVATPDIKRQRVRKLVRALVSGNPALGAHFRNFKMTLDLINESGVNKARRITYAAITRASLSQDLLFLLFVEATDDKNVSLTTITNGYGTFRSLQFASGDVHLAVKELRGFAPAYAFMSSTEREAYWVKNPKERPEFMN